jgi:biopolymer transport protein ExbD
MSAPLLDRDEDGPLYRPMADINVTPFVDVMLVLLIVFMVTAPMLATGVSVRLPQVDAATRTDAARPVTITLTNDGRLFVDEVETAAPSLDATLRAALPDPSTSNVHLRADADVAHGRVVEVMSILGRLGVTRLAILAHERTAP